MQFSLVEEDFLKYQIQNNEIRMLNFRSGIILLCLKVVPVDLGF